MPLPNIQMPNYEFRLQVKFKCDSKSKPDVGRAPSGGSKPSKMDVIFLDLGYLRSKMHISIHFNCFVAIYEEKTVRERHQETRHTQVI